MVLATQLTSVTAQISPVTLQHDMYYIVTDTKLSHCLGGYRDPLVAFARPSQPIGKFRHDMADPKQCRRQLGTERFDFSHAAYSAAQHQILTNLDVYKLGR